MSAAREQLAVQARRPAGSPSRRQVAGFLAALGEGYSVAAAARAAGRRWPRTFYRLRDRDQAFAAAWADAYRDGTDALRDEARRRGVEGWDEPVYQRGELVGHVRKFDSNLLLAELRRRDPAYRDSSDSASGPAQIQLVSILALARESMSAAPAPIDAAPPALSSSSPPSSSRRSHRPLETFPRSDRVQRTVDTDRENARLERRARAQRRGRGGRFRVAAAARTRPWSRGPPARSGGGWASFCAPGRESVLSPCVHDGGFGAEVQVVIAGFSPNPRQLEAARACLDPAARVVVLDGAIRSGKTQVAARILLEQAVEHPATYLVGRATYRSLRDSTQRAMLHGDGALPPLIPPELVVAYRASDEAVLLKGGAEILFRSLEEGDLEKIRGLTLGGVLVDQIEELDGGDAGEAMFDTLLGRLSDPRGPRRMMRRQPGLGVASWSTASGS